MNSRSVRDNPPDTIMSDEELLKYEELYDDITLNGVDIQYSHRHALAELAVQLIEMRTLRLDLTHNGETLEVQGDRNTVTKRNPSRDALDKLRTSTTRLFKEFRLTPGAMGKTMPVVNNDKADDDWNSI